jgi:hypothetical protein
MLPSQDEFAALVVAYPEIPELSQSVPAEPREPDPRDHRAARGGLT